MGKKFNAKVHVTLKKSVLDPQGQTILHAMDHMGIDSISGCRVGKFFEVEIESDSPESARKKLEQVAKDILSNPVIEDFTVDISS